MLAIPRPPKTRGIELNGKDQFIRLGDSSDLSFGNEGSLRSVRAFSTWVKFNEFTNNAHVFDFGDGAGKNNVFLGILGKGDAEVIETDLRAKSKCKDSTIPDGKSGAQWCPELRPQDILLFSKGNVDEFECPGPEIQADGERVKPIDTSPSYKEDPTKPKTRATLLYEVWDSRLRKMQIKINRAIPLDQWVHIVITAKNMDAVRPDIQVYLNGTQTYTQESGFLPQAETTSHNYLGKSNWTDAPGEYELRDELLNGAIFDFRMYNSALSENRVKRILQWGMDKLGLKV
jgi:hypothetical protein